MADIRPGIFIGLLVLVTAAGVFVACKNHPSGQQPEPTPYATRRS